ncbi:MAG TPA: hypothetical protein VGE15_01025 [Sphingobacteriaceae bacterium]
MTNRTKAIIGIAAGTVAAGAALMFYKRKDGSTLGGSLARSAKRWGNNVGNYAGHLKERLLHNVKGPGGESVYVDMYDRQFYENQEGQRVYMDEE